MPNFDHRWSPRCSPALVAVAAILVGAGARAQSYSLVPGAFAPEPCGGSGCWTNHLRVADLDGDLDLDVLFVNYPDFFNGTNSPQPLVLYTNDGKGAFTNVSSTSLGNLVTTARQVAVGDVDGDGHPDLYVPSGAGGPHALLINDGTGIFADQAELRLPATFPHAAAARMGDVDNDGDLDLFVSDAYAALGPPFGHLYLNDGEGYFKEKPGAIPEALTGSNVDDVEFADVDRDFDLDLLVNVHNGGGAALWLNDGKGAFTASATPPPSGSPGNHYNLSACDVDGDGDLDVWIDNIGPSFTEQLLINDGAGHFTDETAARVLANPGADDNGVVCVDLDQDGDLDAVVLSLGTPERLLENDGTGHFTYVAKVFPSPTNCTLWGEFGDLDGDGRADLVTGQGECSSSNTLYLADVDVAVDKRAPTFLAVEDPGPLAEGDSPTLRFAVQDSTVTDEGPRLSRAFVVLDPDGKAKELDARFMGGDLFRVALPALDAGTLPFRVCARDLADNLGCKEGLTLEVKGKAPPPDTDPGDADTAWTGDTVDTDTVDTDTVDTDTGGADVAEADTVDGDTVDADTGGADVAEADTVALDTTDSDTPAPPDTTAPDAATAGDVNPDDVAASEDTRGPSDDGDATRPDAASEAEPGADAAGRGPVGGDAGSSADTDGSADSGDGAPDGSEQLSSAGGSHSDGGCSAAGRPAAARGLLVGALVVLVLGVFRRRPRRNGATPATDHV